MRLQLSLTSLVIGAALFGAACASEDSTPAGGSLPIADGGGMGSHSDASDDFIYPPPNTGACTDVDLYTAIECRVYYNLENPSNNDCFVGQQLCWLDEAGDQVWTDCIEPARVNERIIESISR